MTTGILFGVVIGLGLWVIGRGLRPASPGLGHELARLSQPASATHAGRRIGLEKLAVSAAAALGFDMSLHRQDLAITGRTAGDLAVSKMAAAITGLAVPILFWLVIAVAGGWTSPVLPLGIGTITSLAGWFLPNLRLRESAQGRRAEFVAALALYLDLVAVSLAGGNGAQTALRQAAAVGDTWPFRRLRAALTRADLGNRSPWDELADLADEIGVDELAELTSSMQLAGTTGARVRTTLAAKASSTRNRQLAAVEQEANEASERMSAPLVLMLCGFVVFIGYPALNAVLAI